VDPNVASDANNSIFPVQNRRVGPFRNATPAQLARQSISAERASEAISRVRELDPEWRPTPALTEPQNIEGQIARNVSDAREANLRYADLLRARIGDNNPPKDPLKELSTSRTQSTSSTLNNEWSRGFDPTNLQDKIRNYLLEAENPNNQGKAEWFKKALGFDVTNWHSLASQIYFDPLIATFQRSTPFGDRFEQVIDVSGANGRTVPVIFVFQRDPFGVVSFITAKPRKR
jgi:hypothetical protein